MGHTREVPRTTTVPAARRTLATAPQKKQASPCRRAMLTAGSMTAGGGRGAVDIPNPICSVVRVRQMVRPGKRRKYPDEG